MMRFFIQMQLLPRVPAELLRRALIVLFLVGPYSASLATHDVDHRYTIWGEVRDETGASVADARVSVTGLGGRPLGEGTTGSDGRYRILLHLHNDDLGQRFWVTVDGATREGVVEFDPADRMRPRQQRIDFPAPAP